MNRQLAIALLTTGLASCATVPTPLQGQFSQTAPSDAAKAGVNGEAVRWGGEIIKVEPKADSTCFEILQRELDASARPRPRDTSGGRFIACRSGFYDPQVFERGREMTVTGHIAGTDHGKVGDFDYTYPHVAADTIYLWPRRVARTESPYYDPWMHGYGGFGFGYGPFWGPYWGGPTVIIRERNHPAPPQQSKSGH